MAEEKPQGLEIQKPDIQMMLQDLAATHRALAEERRNAEKRVSEEREQARWRETRLLGEYELKIRDQEEKIRVLLDIVAELRQENDRLRIQVAIADSKDRAGTAGAPPAPVPSTSASALPPGALPLVNAPEKIRMTPFSSMPARPIEPKNP